MDSPVEEVKRRLDVADVIGQTVTLKRSGRILKGLCPFHSEKTPSFVVFPESGTWRCFGCSQGGDLFTFVMKHEGLEFGEALRLLAQRAGVELQAAGGASADRERREHLVRLLESAVLFYSAALRGANGNQAREYLARRGVSDESIDQFALGFSPRQQGALITHLRKAGFTVEDAESAGLVGRGDDGELFERIRGRVIFPIRDPDGRTIAFGGRTLEGDAQPKYLNSPQTELFDKSSCFYGLDLARASVRQSRAITVVEGYMDVIIAHQYGFRDVVATLGTAITERHVRALRRQVDTITLALDADAAGQRATRRGLDVVRGALHAGDEPDGDWLNVVGPTSTSRLNLKVMALPEGRDPDDVIREDPASWASLAASSLPVVDFLLRQLPTTFDLTTARGKSDAVRDTIPIIRDLADPVERAHYEQQLADAVGVDRSAFAFAPVAPRSLRPVQREPSLPRRGPDADEYVLALMVVMRTARTLDEGLTLKPEADALWRLVGGRVSDGVDPANVFDGVEETELGAIAARVQREAVQLAGIDATQLIQQRKIADLTLALERLYGESEDIKTALEGSDDPHGTSWASAMTDVAERINEIERELKTLGRVGSMSWGVRRMRERMGA